MKMKKTLLTICILIISITSACSQISLTGRSWKQVATEMPDSWYGSNESIIVAGNVLLYQRDAGGWPKNTAFHLPLDEAGKAKVRDEKGTNDAIFDNSATTTEMR